MGPPVATHAAHWLQHHQRKNVLLEKIAATGTVTVGTAAVGTLILLRQHDDLPTILEANQRGVLLSL